MANSSNQNRNNNSNQNPPPNPNQILNQNLLNANMINDPLYIASSDHPRMVLSNTPFNGSFHGWSRNVRMALGAKLKFGFIDGSCIKPDVGYTELQRWIRCDYMVTCWILNSMVTELSDAFLYAKYASKLWKEIAERYGQSNGPLVYQLEREFSKITQGNLIIAFYFNKWKKCWDELQNINGLLTCDSEVKFLPWILYLLVNKAYYIVQQIEKQKQVTNHTFEPSAFFDNMNNKGSNNRRKENRGSRIDGKRFCTGCNQEGHTVDQCFKKIGYPDWYKGKKAKKQRRMAVNVIAGIDDHFNGDTRFDLNTENEIGMIQGGGFNQKLVAAVCQEGDCILTATYSINKMHVKILDWKSPYESLYDKPPTYDHLRVIYCLCYAANVMPHKDKFENRGVKCVFIGYPVNKKVFDTHPLEETVIPNTPLPENTPTEHPDNNEPAVEHVEEPITRAPIPSQTSMPVRKSTRSSTRPAWLQDFVTPAKVNSVITIPTYPLFSPSDFQNISFSHVAFLANVFVVPQPTSYKQAIQHEGWVKAMEAELAALERNETWIVTELPPGHKPITFKWVYKTEYKPTGVVDRLKARLEVKGFNQKEGLDYKHTFYPVAKLATVRVLIALATAKQWPLHQLDINNAFLHGYINEEIYMVPPEGYTKASAGQVCKLSKSLYGLKQASRQWNHELTKFLVNLG
nr:hypothetical protein [Tanacetum cinerariifolium]GEZ62660.1 hypothetical protein [Tanacetum cinerariifolium]